MGNTLSPEMLAAFSDELSKEAGKGDALRWGKDMALKPIRWLGEGKKQLVEVAQDPRGALAGGWERMAPKNLLKPGMRETPQGQELLQALAKARGAKGKKGVRAALQRNFGVGTHLESPSGWSQEGKGRIQAAAEELSRRGWTGKGRITKYVPLGEKGQAVGWTATAIPGMVSAPSDVGHTGEGGIYERSLGELSGTGAFIAGTGRGILPGLALYSGANYLGSKAGRILDRLRSGADVGTAVGAPSPTEAAEQLNTIRHYYG